MPEIVVQIALGWVTLLLFGGGIAGAAVLGTIGWRMRREAGATAVR